jgi:hypothetical protein
VQINSGGWLAPIPEIQGAKPNKTSAIKKENILFLLLNMTLLTSRDDARLDVLVDSTLPFVRELAILIHTEHYKRIMCDPSLPLLTNDVHAMLCLETLPAYLCLS